MDEIAPQPTPGGPGPSDSVSPAPATHFSGSDRFAIQRVLGQGGMGVVYQALDVEKQISVALKTLIHLDAQSLLFFKNEFRALADLEHRNLVSLGELVCERGQWFFTMELVEGCDLLTYARSGPQATGSSTANRTLTMAPAAELVDTRVLPPPTGDGGQPPAPAPDGAGTDTDTAPPGAPPVDLERLRDALGQLAEGLLVLHSAGKVHRDVKPSNVLVDLQGRVVLLDFGLVTESRGQGGEDLMVGTPIYMAPEQAALRAVGPAADWYAVGAMLYEALAGRVPFSGTLSEILSAKQVKEPPPPSAFRPVPADLESLAMDLLRLDPSARPTGAEVLHRLEGEAGALAAAQAATAALLAAPSSIFVGRRLELDAVARALGGTQGGRAEVVLISGEQGIGKTSLARRAVGELQASRRRVLPLFGRCYEREAVPFKALDEIVDALSGAMLAMPAAAATALLPPDAPLLTRIFPVLNRVEPLQRMPLPQEWERLDGAQLRARAFVAFRDLLRRLCDQHSVVLVVDDLQWADQDSLALLAEILDPPDAPPVAALFTLRTPPRQAVWSIPAARMLEAVVGELSAVELGPLPLEDAQALARILSAGADSPALRQAAQEAGGHPLYIHELVRHALAAPAAAGAAPAVRLQDAVLARLETLAPGPRALLELLCVASAPLPQGLVFEAAGMDVAEGARNLPALRAAHLARTNGPRAADLVEPFHDRVRDGVLSRLEPAARRELHRRLASALQREGAPSRLRLLVRCLEAAGEVEQAAAQAQRAAELAVTALAFDSAADLFAEALRLGRHAPERARQLQLSRAEALANAGRGPEAAAAYLAAVPGADEASRRDCRRRAAELLLASGHLEEGLSTMGSVLAEVGARLPRTPESARASLDRLQARLRRRGYAWKPRPPEKLDPEVLATIDLFSGAFIGLGAVDNILAFNFNSRALELALEAGEPRRIARGLAMQTIWLSQNGVREPESIELIARADQVARQTSDPVLQAMVLMCEGFGAYYLGRFHEAARLLLASEDLYVQRTRGTAKVLGTTRLMRMQVLRFLGLFHQMARVSAEWIRDAARRGDLYTEVSLMRVCSCLWLARDQPDQALAVLAKKSWAPPAGRFHFQHWYELRTRAEVALYRGDAAACAALRRRLDEMEASGQTYVQVVRCEALWLRGRLALAEAAARSSRRRPALEDAQRAAAALERESRPYATAFAVLLRSALAVQQGSTEVGLGMLERALRAADSELPWVAASIRRRLGELSGNPQIVAQADEWMETEGVRAPGRMVEVVAPGFRVRRG